MVTTHVDKKVVTTINNLTLELGPEETKFLHDVLTKIGGDPATTRRAIADRIRKSMEAAGVEDGGAENRRDIDKTMWFEEAE